MPREPEKLPYVKIVRPTRGGTYYYFKTGKLSAKGKPVYERLPDIKAANFYSVYGAYKAARTRREEDAPDILKVPELVRRYENSPEYRKLSIGTQTTYGYYLRQIEKEFDIAPADEVDVPLMYDLLDVMADRPQAANMLVTVMRNLYKWGRKRRLVTNDPCQEIDAFDGGEYEPWPDELLAEGLASDDWQIRLPVALLYYTAQRIGDVCKMLRSDVGRNEPGHVYVKQQKTGKELEIPVHADLKAILDAAPTNGMTFLAEKRGTPARPATVRVRLQKWAAERGHEIVPHGLRKNAVNALLEAGCSVGEVSSISGQSLAMVEHYAKRRKNRKMASAAILKWEKKA